MKFNSIGETRMEAKHKKFILEKLIPFVLREQGNGFAMGEWIAEYKKEDLVGGDSFSSFDGVSHRPPACGTVACIGGSTQVLLHRGKYTPEPILAKDLGLSPDQAAGLFYNYSPSRSDIPGVFAWPKKYAERFLKAATPYRKAQAAVALLKEVVRTEGACLNPAIPAQVVPELPSES